MLKTGELAMDVGTVLSGDTAVNEGLIDDLGGLKEAIAKLYELVEKDKRAQKRKSRTIKEVE